MGEEGNTPHHCYFWIATLVDGSVIPEYDFDNLKHNHVRDLPVEFVTKFSWYPVSLTMIERVQDMFNEILVLPFSQQIHTINISLVEGERLRIHPVWRNTASFIGHDGMEVKYALFKNLKNNNVEGFWVKEDGSITQEE